MRNKKMAFWIMLMLVSFVFIQDRIDRAMGQGLQIDLHTQKFPYDGKGINQSSDSFSYFEEIMVFASVDYNGVSVPNVLVVYQVDGPLDVHYISVRETNSSGVALLNFTVPNLKANAFGEWIVMGRVRVAEMVAEDRLYFEAGLVVKIISVTTVDEALLPKTEFSPGNVVGINLVVENSAWVSKNVTLVASMEDEIGGILCCVQRDHFEAPSGNSSVVLSLPVPLGALAGAARVHVSALTAPLEEGGIPYSPEVVVPFLIVHHDVAVLSVITSKTEYEVGQQVDIVVKVRNEGSEPESFEVNLSSNQTVLQTFQISSLQSGSIVHLNFSWVTTDIAVGIYVLGAKASLIPEEFDNEDNYGQTIVEITSPPSPPPPQPPPPSIFIPTWLIGLLLAILLLFIILLVAMLLYRRRKRKDYSESFERAWKAWYDAPGHIIPKD